MSGPVDYIRRFLNRRVAQLLDIGLDYYCGTATRASVSGGFEHWTLTLGNGIPLTDTLKDGQRLTFYPGVSNTFPVKLSLDGQTEREVKRSLSGGTFSALTQEDFFSGAPTGVIWSEANGIYILDHSIGGHSYGNVGDFGVVQAAAVIAPNQTWVPTIAGSGAMSTGSTTIYEANWAGLMQWMEFDLSFKTTLGGTPSTIVKATIPVTGVAHNVNVAFPCAADVGGNSYGVSTAADAGDATREEARWRYDGTTIVIFLTNGATWSAGVTTIHIQGRLRYDAATI